MKVVTFGEIMLRLSPYGYTRFLQAENFSATYGGGEANVAVSLSLFGADTEYVTKLPKDDIGQAAVNSLRKYGVGVKYIARGGARTGIYYMEKGASQRASKVIYDRAGSAISEASESDFDFSKIFDGADWFHFTGITPALSDTLADITLKAVKLAKEKGLTVSCDLNYRKKLWTREKAGRVMSGFMPYVDVLIANEEDIGDVFGIKADNTDIESGKLSEEGYKDTVRKVNERFGEKRVAVTLRESISANDNVWSAMLFDGEFYFSRKYNIRIVDRVGGGDSFGAGLIYSYLSGFDKQKTIEFAVAASCLKHTVEGDFNIVTADEVLTLLSSGGSGRIVR